MKVETNVHVVVKDGDLELRVAKGLSTFAYKGQDKFVFRTEELVPLQLMIAAAKIELDAFYAKLPKPDPKPLESKVQLACDGPYIPKVELPPTSSLPVVQLDKTGSCATL
jgi:hypothetical protein